MKITGVKTFPITAGRRNFHFVKVETDEYSTGSVSPGSTSRD